MLDWVRRWAVGEARGADLVCYGDVFLRDYVPYVHSEAVMDH